MNQRMNQCTGLREIFQARHPGAPERLPSGVPLEQALEEACARGRRAWPGVPLEASVFAAHLAAALPAEADLPEWLARVHVEGLYLACACAGQGAEALAEFERQLLSQVPLFLSRLSQEGPFLDDVRQLLRERLFVGPPPRIAEYQGQGSLPGWLRVVAVRVGLELLRRRRRGPQTGEDAGEEALAVGDDPELSYLKERFRGPFQEALRAALAALSSEERNLLRLHFVEHQSIDRLGEIFHVHRSTAARRLQQVRGRVLKQVRQGLREQLRMSDSEVDGLWGLLRSQLDLSIGTMLRSKEAPGG